MDYSKETRKYKLISSSLITIGLIFTLFQLFEWTFITYFTDIGLKGKLIKFVIFLSFILTGILIRLDYKFSFRLLRIIAIGLVVERTIVLIIFSDNLIVPITLIEIIIGIIYVWISNDRSYQMYLLKKKQLTTTTAHTP